MLIVYYLSFRLVGLVSHLLPLRLLSSWSWPFALDFHLGIKDYQMIQTNLSQV